MCIYKDPAKELSALIDKWCAEKVEIPENDDNDWGGIILEKPSIKCRDDGPWKVPQA